jgi:hypothetical protein
LVKDKQKHIPFQEELEKITTIDKKREMLQVDSVKLPKLENV